jgi:nucleoside-diphosphate-sugar epimerase
LFWRNRRVLVTGGAGFIGSNLVDRLVELEAKVRVVDNLERGKPQNLNGLISNIEFIKADLRSAEVAERACKDMEVVFHLAAKVGGIKYYIDRPGEVLLENVKLDSFMLDAAVESKVQRYFYASSAHVYPQTLQTSPDSPPLREHDAVPACPGLSYGWGKLLGEKQIQYMAAQGINLRAAIVRLVGAYGKNQDLDLESGSAIPVFIRRAIEYPERKPFVIWGNGAETRSYCYIDDVVNGMLLAVEKLSSHKLLGPINLGSEERISIRELGEQIVELSGKKIPIQSDSSRETVIWGQAVDCSKARELLDGWRPRVSLQDGLRRTYQYVEKRLNVKNY